MPPKQVQLFLCPTPGAKPEFLATIESITRTALDSSLPERIVLENYTRDGWATQPIPSLWQSYHVKSVDGRNKLPGFLKYLKDRQKSAYGRFADNTSVLIVPAAQRGAPAVMQLMLSWDITSIPDCTLLAVKTQPAKPAAAAAAAAPATKRKGGAGLLGNLLASQQRTNAHVQKANAKTVRPKTAAAPQGNNNGVDETTPTVDSSPPPTKTAQQAIAEFRAIMEERLLDFDLSSEPVLKIPIVLADHIKGLIPEELPKVDMEILKYIVYEQAEEINEEWVAHKEPSEYLDDVVIAVYKEGEAPPDVLEDMNQGELPDEVKGQMAHASAQNQMRAEQKHLAQAADVARRALAGRAQEDGDALNRNKRDRRTIEEIQMDSKRARME